MELHTGTFYGILCFQDQTHALNFLEQVNPRSHETQRVWERSGAWRSDCSRGWSHMGFCWSFFISLMIWLGSDSQQHCSPCRGKQQCLDHPCTPALRSYQPLCFCAVDFSVCYAIWFEQSLGCSLFLNLLKGRLSAPRSCKAHACVILDFLGGHYSKQVPLVGFISYFSCGCHRKL